MAFTKPIVTLALRGIHVVDLHVYFGYQVAFEMVEWNLWDTLKTISKGYVTLLDHKTPQVLYNTGAFH